MKHGVEPFMQLAQRWNLIGNARVANLGLRTDDALRDRGRRREKRAGNLLRREAAHFAQRERDLRVGRERGVTTGKDESKAVVFDLVVIQFGRGVMLVASRSVTSMSFASNRARRLTRSMDLKRPVEMSHARGLAGIPSSGQRSTAVANASWSASSARSKSPSSRMSVASTRRDSLR